MGNNTIIEETKKTRGRDTKFRHTKSSDGTYSCTIDADINKKLNEICDKKDICKKEFVNNLLLDALTTPQQVNNSNNIVLSEESMQALKLLCKYKKIDNKCINGLIDYIIDEYFKRLFS